jgi:hypothetical protein
MGKAVGAGTEKGAKVTTYYTDEAGKGRTLLRALVIVEQPLVAITVSNESQWAVSPSESKTSEPSLICSNWGAGTTNSVYPQSNQTKVFLADVHGRQVDSFLPSKGNGKHTLKVLLARGCTLLTGHVPSSR